MLAFLLSLSSHTLCESLSATVPALLSNKGGVPRARVPQECQPFPSLAFKALSLPSQLATGLSKRQNGLGEAQHSARFVGKWEDSTKSFQTKGINIICGSIRLPGAQYGSDSATCSFPGFCAKAGWNLPRHILALQANTLEGLPSSLSPVWTLFSLSLSQFDNGRILSGKGSAWRRGNERRVCGQMEEQSWTDGAAGKRPQTCSQADWTLTKSHLVESD